MLQNLLSVTDTGKTNNSKVFEIINVMADKLHKLLATTIENTFVLKCCLIT